MRKWTAHDRQGREIYLTEERWQHIISRHKPLVGHLDDVLRTIRLGQRRQDPLKPFKFFYHRRCDGLSGSYNSITVVVLDYPDNRYVITAWPEVA